MINLPVLYSQFDIRWGNKILGNNTDPIYNIYNDGCLVTVLASILMYFGISIDPAMLNDDLVQKNGFPKGSGEYIWGSVVQLFSQILEYRTVTPGKLTDQQMGDIRSAIDSGFPVVIQIDYNPKTSNLESHFVCIVAYDPNDENNLTIYDPLGGKIHSLKDYLGWFDPGVRDTIQQYAIYKGPLPVTANLDTMIIQKSIFPPLVHGSTQWDQTVGKYLSGDPKQTDFSALEAFVSSLQDSAKQSGQDSANSQAIQDLAVAKQEISNEQENLALFQQQRQNELTTFQAHTDALNTVIKQKDTQILSLQDQITTVLNDKHELASKLVSLQNQQPTISFFQKIFPTIISFLQKKGK